MEWTVVLHAIVSHIPDANTIAAIAGAGSALAAFLTIRKSTASSEKAAATRENERLLTHAVTTLERSFSALVGSSQNGTIPPANYLNWLTAARLIEEYKATKIRISDSLILQECESHEEHWRHQFFIRLFNLAGRTREYYSKATGGEICPVSAVIIHSFADRPYSRTDPLSKYPCARIAAEDLNLSDSWYALREYCELTNQRGTGC